MNTFNTIIFIVVTCLLFSTIESRRIGNGSKARANAVKREKELEEKYAPKILKWKKDVDEICNALGYCHCIYHVIDNLEKHEGNKTHVLQILQEKKRGSDFVTNIYLGIFIFICTMIFIGQFVKK